jgi:hypothetical protein
VIPSWILASTTVEREFRWLSAPAPWLTFLVLLPAAAILAWYLYRRERGDLTPAWRLGLAGLRFLLLAAALAVLFEPVISLVKREERSAHVLVLIDVSHSMNVTDDWSLAGDDPEVVKILGPEVTSSRAPLSRIDVIKRILSAEDGAWLRDLGQKGVLRLMAFSRKSREIGEDVPRGQEEGLKPLLDAIEALDARGEGGDETHIANAIHESVLGLRGRRIAAIVVMSDWQETGGDMTLADVPAQLVRPDTKMPIPVTAVGIGSPTWPRDTALVGFTGPDRVLAGDNAEFTATIQGQGVPPETPLTLDLLVDGVFIKSVYPNLPAEGRRTQAFVDHRFPARGTFKVTLRLRPQPREADENNNEATRDVEVVERKIKIVYVEDPPRWDYRYLKNFLSRDPTVEFQALLVSADPRFRQETSLHPPLEPLTRFPPTRAELFAYDVVIVGDVDPATKFTNEELENIRAFAAEGGGGIIFIAGEYYNPRAYAHTPLADALPVEVEEGGESSLAPREAALEPFRVRLTSEGLEHPLMRLVPDKEENRDLWENTDGLEQNSLPGFWWFAPVARLKKGAIALAVHPTKRHLRYGPRVIFATEIFGKGRTFFSAVDSTWRWRAGVGGVHFDRFWGQVIRHVAASRLRGETARFQLGADKLTYHPGDLAVITARILDEELRPSTEREWRVILQGPDKEGERRTITLRQDDPTQPGTFTASVEAGAFGSYVLFFEEKPEVRASLRVVVPEKERRDTRMNEEEARQIAKATGGSYYTLSDVHRLPDAIEQVRQELLQTTSQDPLWSRWWVVVLVVAIAGLEWGLRKLRRLL